MLTGALVAAVALVAFGADSLNFVRERENQQRTVAHFSIPSQVSQRLGLEGGTAGVRLAFLAAMLAGVGAALVLTARGRLD